MVILADILAARQVVRHHIRHTPLTPSPALSQLSKGQVYLKLECWQRTGSFKERGALTKLTTLTAEEWSRGVVTASSGNHGLGVAFASQALGLPPALIFVPETTNISKLLQSIQRNFTRNYKKAHDINEPIRLWQRGFWDHVVRDERDFANHLHYIHYNPVKHGYTSNPETCPHTSFHEYVKRGWYEPGWGHTEPEVMSNLDSE